MQGGQWEPGCSGILHCTVVQCHSHLCQGGAPTLLPCPHPKARVCLGRKTVIKPHHWAGCDLLSAEAFIAWNRTAKIFSLTLFLMSIVILMPSSSDRLFNYANHRLSEAGSPWHVRTGLVQHRRKNLSHWEVNSWPGLKPLISQGMWRTPPAWQHPTRIEPLPKTAFCLTAAFKCYTSGIFTVPWDGSGKETLARGRRKGLGSTSWRADQAGETGVFRLGVKGYCKGFRQAGRWPESRYFPCSGGGWWAAATQVFASTTWSSRPRGELGTGQEYSFQPRSKQERRRSGPRSSRKGDAWHLGGTWSRRNYLQKQQVPTLIETKEARTIRKFSFVNSWIYRY